MNVIAQQEFELAYYDIYIYIYIYIYSVCMCVAMRLKENSDVVTWWILIMVPGVAQTTNNSRECIRQARNRVVLKEMNLRSEFGGGNVGEEFIQTE